MYLPFLGMDMWRNVCIFVLGFGLSWLSIPVFASNNSLSTILEAINELEKKSEPKCYATASRLEDFMFGTPLNTEARFAKNILQKNYVNQIWGAASQIALAENEPTILQAHIFAAQKLIFQVEKDKIGHFVLTFVKQSPVVIHKDDKRQYGSIAYSLRAVLALQQEALINFNVSLLPLSDLAVIALKDSLDLFTLSVLKLVDTKAKLENKSEVDVSSLYLVWNELGGELALSTQTVSPTSTAKNSYSLMTSSLLVEMVKRKLNSYAAYNKVNNQLFLRNLQVYFAKVTWPKQESERKEIIESFSDLVTSFAFELYRGAQQGAMNKNELTISEASVYDYSQLFMPHVLNEFEDAIFFPKLSKNKQIYIESYDMDAFRDAGAHWQYLLQAIQHPDFKLYIDPTPFAAELLVENIAQYGVLLFRVAGRIAKENKDHSLKAAYVIEASQFIQQHVALHNDPANHAQAIVQKELSSSVSDDVAGLYFEDQTDKNGIAFEHHSSDWLNRQLRSFIKKSDSVGVITVPPAFGGSGVAAEDINNDGLIDLLLLGGRGNKLFINQGNGTFEDQTEQYRLNWKRHSDKQPGEVRQPIFADFNNDGWQDLVLTYVNDQHRVYKNVSGQYFEDVTNKAALGGEGLVGGPATAFDYDNDGDLDIYITYFGNYLVGELPTLQRHNTNGRPNQLFKNIGDFQFENVTQGSGLDNTGWAQAVAHTDLNNDGWQDVIVGNDFGVNGYYYNLKNGTFKEVTTALGTDKPSYTMGIGIADLNQDQLPDIYVSNIVAMNKDETYVLPNEDTLMKFDAQKLANMRVIEANDLFISSKNSQGLTYTKSNKVTRGYSSTGWSWDADFFDADLDGDDDLYVLNGMNEFNLYSSENPYFQDEHGKNQDVLLPVSEKEENVYFENTKGSLQIATKQVGLDLIGNSRSASYFDSDNDGDLDIIINNYHESATLYVNKLESNKLNWLKIQLQGDELKQVNRDAIGAKLLVTLPNGKIVWREIRSTDGYMSVHPKTQHFGLGRASKVDVKIIWPNGKEQQINDVAANQSIKFSL